MNKIILDLDGVVFEPIKELVIHAAIKKYGVLRAAGMFARYCLDEYRAEILDKIAPLIRDCRERAKFLPGAEGAIEYLTGRGDCTVDVCSTMPFDSDVAELEKFYRSRAACMDKIGKYSLNGMTVPKIEFYRMSMFGWHNMYVLDDSMQNIKSAYLVNATPVLITNRSHAARRAAEHYNAMNFDSLCGFVEYMQRCKSL